jgi:phage tail-like protein
MAQFVVNSTRLDPYKNFKFIVSWQSQPGGPFQAVAGISKVSVLKRTTEVVEFRDGGDFSSFRKSPGRNKFDPITLERGVTWDPEFERWANKVWDYQNAQAPAAQRTMEVSLADFRKEIIIDVFNEAGQKVLSYQVYRCWVSEYQALPDLDANANAIAIQHIKLENEGWIRDPAVVEVPEPSFTDPAS